MHLKDSAIIFDLDGTLVDTAPDLLSALNHVLTMVDCPLVDIHTIRNIVGKGAKVMISKGLSLGGIKNHEEQAEILLPDFISFYKDNIAINSRIFDNLIPALDELKSQEAKLGVCTNKQEELAIKLLHEIGLEHYFSTIVGADTFEYRKPDPRHILSTIDRIKGNPQNSVMIGDSITDINAAKAAKIPVIAVPFGYTDIPIYDLNPTAIVDNYKLLVSEIQNILKS